MLCMLWFGIKVERHKPVITMPQEGSDRPASPLAPPIHLPRPSLSATTAVVSIVLLSSEFQIAGIKRYVTFSDWLLSLRNMYLRFLCTQILTSYYRPRYLQTLSFQSSTLHSLGILAPGSWWLIYWVNLARQWCSVIRSNTGIKSKSFGRTLVWHFFGIWD